MQQIAGRWPREGTRAFTPHKLLSPYRHSACGMSGRPPQCGTRASFGRVPNPLPRHWPPEAVDMMCVMSICVIVRTRGR